MSVTKAVTVYSTSTCSYCVQLKQWLSDNDISYEEVNLSLHPEMIEEFMATTGVSTVPVTKIDDEYIIGFDKNVLSVVFELGAGR